MGTPGLEHKHGAACSKDPTASRAEGRTHRKRSRARALQEERVPSRRGLGSERD